MFTITSIVIVTLIKNVGKPTFIFTDFLHFILPFTIKNKLYCKGKNLISYGLKLVPSDSEAIELKNLIDFLEK